VASPVRIVITRGLVRPTSPVVNDAPLVVIIGVEEERDRDSGDRNNGELILRDTCLDDNRLHLDPHPDANIVIVSFSPLSLNVRSQSTNG
jgi:hypothetical protein